MRHLVVAMLLIAGCSGSMDPAAEPLPPEVPTPPVVNLEAATPTELTAVVATDVAPVPVVRATDSAGHPVSGMVVAFDVGNTGGAVTNTAIKTDVDGLASPGRWTLGTLAGDQILSVRAGGLLRLQFKAHVKPGPPAYMGRSGGHAQVGTGGAQLSNALWVRVGDAFGNPVPGVPVKFVVVSGDGHIAGDSALTDADGSAVSGPWTLGSTTGVQRVVARTSSAAVEFAAFACGDCPPLLFVRGPYIYRTNGFSGDEVQLTFGSEPAWSPDGKRIAFVRYDINNFADIYVMDADGSNVARRTFGEVPSGFHSPAWSPDGKRLAVVGAEGEDSRIYVLNAAPDDVIPSAIAKSAAYPAWSPDGAQIAFVKLGGEWADVLHVMNADGTGVRALTARGGYPSLDRPAWSPDGQRIVVSECLLTDCQLFAIAIDGSAPKQLTSTGMAFSPAWSSNGAWIAFTSRSGFPGGPTSQTSIMLLPADMDGTLFTIVSSGSLPAWRP